jgi:hypothetical protein
MKTIIYILVIFLLPASLFGQETLVIKGQVTDAEKHEPLAECHVYVSCQHFGTITDENGNFELEIPKCYMTQCLIVSYMGYERFVFPIHDIGNKKMNIELNYNVIALAEIVIKPDCYRIIFKAEFETYEPEIPEIITALDEHIEAMSNYKIETLNTMY